MSDLSNRKVAVLATNGFDDAEMAGPVAATREAGGEVTIIAPAAGVIEGKKGSIIEVDLVASEASAADFDALLLPGGTSNADKLRMDEGAVNFVREIFAAEKPTGVICHGGWILTDAEVLQGRTLTSFASIKTDLRNAGATWVDEEVHNDNGLVSSRTPADLPAYNAAILREFGK